MKIRTECPECGYEFELSSGLKEWKVLFDNGDKCTATDVVCPTCGVSETVQADNSETKKLLKKQVEYLGRKKVI